MFGKKKKEQTSEITIGENTDILVGKKKKKSKKTLFLVLGIVAVIVVLVIVAAIKMSSTAVGLPVSVTEALNGDIEQRLDTSGLVGSEESKQYFAQVDATVSTVDVKAGDTVKEGQSLLTYNLSDLELAAQKAELSAKAGDLDTSIATTTINDSKGDAAKAAADYANAEKMIAHYADCMATAQGQINRKAELENTLIPAVVAQIAALDPASPTYATDKQTLEAKQAELQKEWAGYDVDKLNASIATCAADKADYKAIYEANKTAKDADPTLDLQLSKQGVLKKENALTKEQIGKDLDTAKAGVTADFGGIVTKVTAVEGQAALKGAALFTVEDDQNVKVTVNLSKYDLEKIATGQKAVITIAGKEYEGTVSRINRMAEVNAAGAAMVSADIHIENPDSNIYLGIEAKVSILTASEKETLLVPIECVNYDKKGTFCYVVEDGIVKRKEVETGISSDEYTQIISGVDKGAKIVKNVTEAIVDGMNVTPIEEQ